MKFLVVNFASGSGHRRAARHHPHCTGASYPARLIRLVISTGGAYDFVGRPWADRMKHSLGTVVVENSGGGGGSLGAAAVARAQPDGYTLLLGGRCRTSTGPGQAQAALRSDQRLDRLPPSPPIFSASRCILQPVESLKELIAYAKANPGKLSYGHAGAGSISI
jgi:tripartite-type tricarboxylate transporter receptor subunit TctC